MQYGTRTTTRADGDFVDVALFDADTTWLRQVHGARVVIVEAPGQHAGEEADAAVTTVPGAKLAVRTADCVPIVLTTTRTRGNSAPSGRGIPSSSVLGVVHAGWKGLAEGVVAATVDAMRDLGADAVMAAIGPCIHVECYEFGEPELSTMVERFGPSVLGRTKHGTPALDLPAAASIALAEAGVPSPPVSEHCTSCRADLYYSWRARQESERFATIAWIEA